MDTQVYDPRRLASIIIGLDALHAELVDKVDHSITQHILVAIGSLSKAHAEMDFKFYYEVPDGYKPPKGTCGKPKQASTP